MKLKTIDVDGGTYAEIRDGKPVYVDDGGEEKAYDPIAMHATIGRLNREAQTHREAKEALEAKAAAFEGLDPEAARKAVDTLKNLDQKKLLDAGEVDKIKQEQATAYQKQIEQAKQEAEQLRSQYAQEKVLGAFSGSKFIKDRLAIPPDMAQAAFGKHFKFSDGRITPVDGNGNPIYSDANPGDVAGFDEALEKLVNQYPHRDSILRGSGNSGSGAGPVDGDGARTISRQQFESLSPPRRAEMARAMNEGKVKLV